MPNPPRTVSTTATTNFFEPLDHPAVLAFTDWVVQPGLQHLWGHIRRFDVSDADLARLRALHGQPALLCPNHPTLMEPVVFWGVLRRAGLRANFVMARATMEQLGRWRPLAQRMGVFSVRRGVADRPSFAKTRELLTAGKAIVMFPEGETYGLNDTLLGFQEGVAQLGFWGSQDRAKAGLDGAVKLVPIAIKHTYLRDMRPEIDRTLGRLEQELGLAADVSLERYPRLRRVGMALVRTLLAEYGVTMPEEATLNELIDAMYGQILSTVSQRLGVTLEKTAGLQDQLRRMFALIHDEIYQTAPDASAYQMRLQAQRAPGYQALERDLARLQIFQAVRDRYVASHPSAERYLDTLNRLETEILGRGRYWGPRRAEVRVGEAIDLAEWMAAYQDNRRTAVDQVTAELQNRVQGLLQPMIDATPTLSPPILDHPGADA